MKVVVNRCFGGFGLSMEAQRLLAAAKGKTAFFYVHEKYRSTDGFDAYRRATDADVHKIVYVLTTDMGDTPESIDGGQWMDDCRGDEHRSDPDLVLIVEQLGAAANGQFSELEVVDIPDGVDWEIDDYDGRETVRERSRSW